MESLYDSEGDLDLGCDGRPAEAGFESGTAMGSVVGFQAWEGIPWSRNFQISLRLEVELYLDVYREEQQDVWR